jgi:heptosyltransferase-2
MAPPLREILVRATNWVGDAVLTTPVFRALKLNHPEARITVVARPWVAEVFEGNPHIDRLVLDRDRSRAGLRQLMDALRATRFDLGLALPNSLSSAMLLWRAGARRRIGFARGGRSLLLTDAIPLPAWLLEVHQVNYYLYLLRGFCDRFDGVRRLDLHLADRDVEQADEVVSKLRPRSPSRPPSPSPSPPTGAVLAPPIVVVAPGAAFGTAKRWPPRYYAQLIARLVVERGAAVALVGSKGEAPVAAEILRHLRDLSPAASGGVVDTCGRLSLKGTAALIARADRFFTNDSGAMHLAAALDVPTTAFFGPTDWLTTSPRSPAATIVRDRTECAPCLLRHCPIDHRCMTKLRPEMVADGLA